METKKVVLIFILFLSQACATSQKTRPSQEQSSGVQVTQLPLQNPTPAPEIMGPPESFGPPEPTVTEKPNEYGPMPVSTRPITLILGPGMARGFAYVGAIRALNEAKIPIGAIFGTEVGGLMGCLYGLSASINQFEWGLLKLKDDSFKKSGGIFSSENKLDDKLLERRLSQIFGGKNLSQARVPTYVGFLVKDEKSITVLNQGEVVPILRGAMANPSWFSATEWQGKEIVSTNSIKPFLVDEGRGLGKGPVVVIDVLKEKDQEIALDELKAADLVIRPDLSKIDYLDFQKKSEAAFQGKNAIIQNMREIKRLVGLPDTDSDKKAFGVKSDG